MKGGGGKSDGGERECPPPSIEDACSLANIEVGFFGGRKCEEDRLDAQLVHRLPQHVQVVAEHLAKSLGDVAGVARAPQGVKASEQSVPTVIWQLPRSYWDYYSLRTTGNKWSGNSVYFQRFLNSNE
jgi:hypothetical protein